MAVLKDVWTNSSAQSFSFKTFLFAFQTALSLVKMQFSALLATIAGLAVGVSSAAFDVRGEDVGCVGACGHDYACISQCFDKRGLETRQSAAQQCVFGCAKDDYGCYANCFNKRDERTACVGACGHDYACIGRCLG
ncbi:hypothetical protein GCG54_00001855 [Colletotrichum gloeosporioides]|uniref:Uncharacterized protein n=1 Tax=Colletotrichum gloeosporioides TaxID=474922 RepID=A0A8H4CWR1_COLGL|nr:uncharacterized protein GCG54_00001855 [Colletotrichum gloeosporioides]KAF3811528.1 hypothetical protein GCG54_00001855 [Colletotrichum gloeosporioides]